MLNPLDLEIVGLISGRIEKQDYDIFIRKKIVLSFGLFFLILLFDIIDMKYRLWLKLVKEMITLQWHIRNYVDRALLSV